MRYVTYIHMTPSFFLSLLLKLDAVVLFQFFFLILLLVDIFYYFVAIYNGIQFSLVLMWEGYEHIYIHWRNIMIKFQPLKQFIATSFMPSSDTAENPIKAKKRKSAPITPSVL